jgi:hypothetical protein
MKKKKSRSGKAAQTVPPLLSALPFRLPPILLEGDEPVAPAPSARPLEIEAARLPQTYGTRSLLLAARDPHWLYAHWDIAPEEQRQYSAMAVDQRLVLRVYEGAISGPPAAQVHLHPDSRHWSVFVPRPETRYVAELGCPLPGGLWQSLATSEVVATPPDTVSQDKTVQFATLEPLAPAPATPAPRPARQASPPQLPIEPEAPLPLPPAQHPTAPQGPLPPPSLAPAPCLSSEAPAPDLPASVPHPEARLRPVPPPAAATRDAALEQFVANAQFAPDEAVAGISSPGGEPSLAAVPAGPGDRPPPVPPPAAATQDAALEQFMANAQLAPDEAVAGISSPGGEPSLAANRPPREFWLNVNAELVLYGATEPDARVAIAGQPIRLRPDGSFSYRFALLDGNYDMVVTAVSAHNDQRQVRLQFSRRTG